MRNLQDYLVEAEEQEEIKLNGNADEEQELPDYEQNNAAIPGGIDIALVGEIRYYSSSDDDFKQRKKKIADYYKKEHPSDMDWNAEFICGTPIFKLYVRDVIEYYKKNVDEFMKLNVSSHDELERQLANDIIILSKNHAL